MEATLSEKEALIVREQIRTFHVSGQGIEDAAPQAPLHPVVLDQLEPISTFETSGLRSVYESALAASRSLARKRFLTQIKHAHTALTDLIALDDRLKPEAGTGQSASSALGNEGAAFFNTGAMAAVLKGSRRGLRRMETGHRRRIEDTITALDGAMREIEQQPACFQFDGPDSFQVALDFSTQQLARFSSVLRALRLARLESESAYNPSLHEDALKRLDWQSATAEELLALPPVVIFETAEHLADTSLTALGRVLRSGRPIHVVVTSQGLSADDLSGFAPDFGYIAIAHREAFVVESSLARPEHLSAGLVRMTRTLRPAVAIVSVPERDDVVSRLAVSLLDLSRAFPLYIYDPDRGPGFTSCFELVVSDEAQVTAADYAALSRTFRKHFRVIPSIAWSEEQIELSEYLKRFTTDPPLAVPFIFVTTEGGEPQRAVVSRELVNLCRDRMRAWKIFEDLSRTKVAAAPEPEVTPAVPQADEKLEGAKLAIERVVGMLFGQNAVPAAVSVPVPAPQAAKPYQILDPAPPQSEDAVPEDPYIDSFLCTSCNDCFKINPRVFQYDGNKQAFIADAGAGTFAELVKAAEGCPAKCIHPGSPRAGDATVTPQLLAKAAKLR